MIYVYIACILLILLLLLFTSRTRIKQKYNKYTKIANAQGLTGAQVAQYIIKQENLDLSLAQNEEDLCDAYYPKKQLLLMSGKVCNTPSIASVAIVCHELGHATQNRDKMPLYKLYRGLSAFTRFASKFILPLLIFGLLFHALRWPYENLGMVMCISSGVIFILQGIVKLLIIPIEFNASKRAVKLIEKYNLLTKKEIHKSKSILNTAGQTYIVALFDGITGFTRKVFRKIFK